MYLFVIHEYINAFWGYYYILCAVVILCAVGILIGILCWSYQDNADRIALLSMPYATLKNETTNLTRHGQNKVKLSPQTLQS